MCAATHRLRVCTFYGTAVVCQHLHVHTPTESTQLYFTREHRRDCGNKDNGLARCQLNCYGNVGKCPCTSQCTSSSTALACIVDLVDLIRVSWHVTYAEELLLSCSLVEGSSTSLFRGSLWISMLSNCPITSGNLPLSGFSVLCGLDYIVCWPPKRRIYNITPSSLQHRSIFCFCSVTCSQRHYLD